MLIRCIFIVIGILFCGFSDVHAQAGKNISSQWLMENYTKREVMIPMRDGSRMYTVIYEPLGVDNAVGRPVIMTRTPYSLSPYGLKPGSYAGENVKRKYDKGIGSDMYNYAAERYIIVYQNVRGRYLSEGEYENVRPLETGDEVRSVDGEICHAVDDATDVYDTVEWLLVNTCTNGNVGVKGVSYPGFYTTLAALSRHPAIKAVSPQAPIADWFMGDDAHHNGALCLADSYRFGSSMYRVRKTPSTKGLSKLFNTEQDIYEYFKGRPMSELSAFFGDSLVFWNQMMEHPSYDKFWTDRDPTLHLENIAPAVLVTGGFYDAEDCYGTFRTYEKIKELSPDTELYIAVGPWYHGGWNNRTYNHLGDAWFGEASGAYYQDNVEYPFFRWYLDGAGTPPAKVNALPSGETMKSIMAGVPSDDYWQTYSSWPPAEMEYRKLFLTNTDSIYCQLGQERFKSRGVPGRLKGVRSYVSDPASPVPYLNVESNSRDRAYMTADQSFAADRPDVLTYWGRELTDTLHLAGKIKVNLAVCLTDCSGGSGRLLDGDIIVKLIDVRPDGVQMLVRGDVMPLRLRNSFASPVALKSGRSSEVSFMMADIDHYFMPGHKLMVQVQSSWFPLIAMNPQSYLENQYDATSEDYRKVNVSVISGRSWLELPVIPGEE